MHSTVKFPAAYFRRRPYPFPPALWAWVLLTSLVITKGVARPHQDFPIAAEEQHHDFRSDGTYSFSYDTGGGEHQSFRIETRDATGRVSGRYGYIDPDGALRITQYQADSTGYRANMLIYRKVSSPPPEPLLVGPLPRRVPDPEAEGSARSAPPSTSTGPIGPVPFFPPDKPVLIIGPLPKPLQPSRGDDDEEAFVPGEIFGFDASQDVSLSSSVQDVQEDIPSPIKDVPQGPPPASIPSGILKTILQDNFNRLFQGPIPEIDLNSVRGDSEDMSLNALQEGAGIDGPRPTSSRDDLVRISQELLQGPEVIVNMTPEVRRTVPRPLRPLRVNRTRSNDTEDRVPRAPPINPRNVAVANTRLERRPELNTSFDVFIKIVTDSPTLNLTQERQNNSVPVTSSSFSSNSSFSSSSFSSNSSFSSSSSSSLSSSSFSSSSSSSSSSSTSNNANTIPTPPITLKKKDTTSISRPTVRRTFTYQPRSEVNREKISKPDTQRAPSLAVPINLPPVPINLPPVPPLTYLPADNTKVPMHSTFVGQLPDY